jgi:hypothetical protein
MYTTANLLFPKHTEGSSVLQRTVQINFLLRLVCYMLKPHIFFQFFVSFFFSFPAANN